MKGDAATVTGATTFTATLLVHGTRKPVSGQARITRSGTDVRVEASFPVNLPDFGIPEPRYLGVGRQGPGPGEGQVRECSMTRVVSRAGLAVGLVGASASAPRRRAEVPLQAVHAVHDLPRVAHRRRAAERLRAIAVASRAVDDRRADAVARRHGPRRPVRSPSSGARSASRWARCSWASRCGRHTCTTRFSAPARPQPADERRRARVVQGRRTGCSTARWAASSNRTATRWIRRSTGRAISPRKALGFRAGRFPARLRRALCRPHGVQPQLISDWPSTTRSTASSSATRAAAT